MPPKGQTNHDIGAADHTTCFYCHQQLLLAGCKVIVEKDAHGCAIRICEPCKKKEVKKKKPSQLEILMGVQNEDSA